jgi:Right handed beta helix region
MKIYLLTFFFFCYQIAFSQSASVQRFYVSNIGKDLPNYGSSNKPFASIDFALIQASKSKNKQIEIFIKKGIYYLTETIRLSQKDWAEKKLSIIGNNAIVSGGKKLKLKWVKYDNKIWMTPFDSNPFEQLFVNNQQQILARYPNYDSTARNFNGSAADALEKLKSWKNSAGAYVHALHEGEWGSFHYQVSKVKNNEIIWTGGWQNNRPAPLHKNYRFVENAFEALDNPNEWYYDKSKNTIYYYPSLGIDPNKAVFVASNLIHSIEIIGAMQKPIRNIKISGIKFQHNERTFMQPYEPLLRSDWRIYRGGAILLENTENCIISECEFSDMGGNAVFFSRYNKNSTIKSSLFHDLGASAICFVGDTSAVRSASFQYDFYIPYQNLDKAAGPKNEKYPRQCTATDNLIYRVGQVEKQSTGVHIEMSSEILVSHNSIYDVPRAGLNIGSGAWGGHIFEFNDVFDTVQETGDHGSFNSWGRDRFWHPNRKTMDELVAAHPELILLDAQKTVTIRNNRFRCDHGWDIDLDDGSSNFHIYNNLCLNGGIKLREGFFRKVENNIMINNSFHPHVWFNNSGDEFQHNIVQKKYFPIVVNDWGNKIDQNIFPDQNALAFAQKNKTDFKSIVLNPEFENSVLGDFTVKANSKIFEVGFKNFRMDNFGVVSPKLKQLARQPKIPDLKLNELLANKSAIIPFLGGEIKAIEGLGDRSAYGLPDEFGVIVVSLGADNLLKKSGLEKGDVIREADGETLKGLKQLIDIVQSSNWKPSIPIEIIRNQKTVKLDLILK